jgi:ELWxxDGT repeat protein
MIVRDIQPGRDGAFPTNLTEMNGMLFFTSGFELWRSDGTEDGTVLVKDISPGVTGVQPPHDLTEVNGMLFFTAADTEHGTELWRSDGTRAGTELVEDIWPGVEGSFPRSLTDVEGTLLFTADDGFHGVELWTLPP